MHSHILKYQGYISQFADCPPSTYQEIDKVAYRWVESISDTNSFIPVLMINPIRKLENEDDSCKGYALSMFDTKEGAFQKYKNLVKRKPNLKNTFGTKIAELALSKDDGVASEADNNNYTHFSFHEYSAIDLSKKIINIVHEFTFDENGNFKS